MDIIKAIEERYSCRKFREEEVSDEFLKEIVRLGNLAPSINNAKPWQFTIIKNREMLKQMSNIVEDEVDIILKDKAEEKPALAEKIKWYSTFFRNAPSLIVISTREVNTPLHNFVGKEMKGDVSKLRNHPEVQSLGACVQNMLLGAQDKDLGACWLSAPVMAGKRLESLIKNHDDGYHISAMIAIGFPAVERHTKRNCTGEEPLIRFIK